MAEELWFYAANEQQHGPMTLESLRRLLSLNQVQPHDLVWTAGMTQWTPAHSVAQLSDLVPPGGAPQDIMQPMSVHPGMLQYGHTPGHYAMSQGIEYASFGWRFVAVL